MQVTLSKYLTDRCPHLSLDVMVTYDIESNEVVDTIAIYAYFNNERVSERLPTPFMTLLKDELDQIVDSIDWREVYAETEVERRQTI